MGSVRSYEDIIVQLPYSTYEKFNAYKSNGQSALLQEVKGVLQKTVYHLAGFRYIFSLTVYF